VRGDISERDMRRIQIRETILSHFEKPVLRQPAPEGAMGVLLGVFLYFFYLVPGIIYTIVRCSKKSKYKKAYEKELAEYNAVYPAKIKELNGKLADLRIRAANCISKK
ncbi:MAG: hypothetical protein K2K04_04995, partial [Clostridia bacterium]|nr:hypothetical protein [Clostridia bacterium]